MSQIDVPLSVRPKLNAIERNIAKEYEKARISARNMVEAFLNCGRELTIAKEIITPQTWMRWCDESTPFSDRWARKLIKMWSDYVALPEPQQTRLLESTTSVKSAIRFLDPEKPVGQRAEPGSVPGQQITERDSENGDNNHENAGAVSQDAPPQRKESKAPRESKPAEPDP